MIRERTNTRCCNNSNAIRLATASLRKVFELSIVETEAIRNILELLDSRLKVRV
jgi:hypothetical protein